MPLKIALTGATGFVGRATVPELLSKHYHVSVLVRGSLRANLPGELRQVRGNLTDSAALDDLMSGADVAIHIAGVTGALSTSDYFAGNEQGSRMVAEAAARNGVKRFVHISSLAAREPALSIYGASKRAGEAAVEKFTAKMSVVILRPPAVYGPGDQGTLPLLRALTKTIAIIPGNRMSRFSLIYVGDLARTIVEAAVSARSGVVELDDGQRRGYSWSELARISSTVEQKSIIPVFLPRFLAMPIAAAVEVIERKRGVVPFVSPDKIRQLYFGNWVARGDGWPLEKPVGFAQGLTTTLGWYRQARWLPRRFHKNRIVA